MKVKTRSQLLRAKVRFTPSDTDHDEDYSLESVEPSCSCPPDIHYRIGHQERICDTCWLEEAVACCGVKEILLPEVIGSWDSTKETTIELFGVMRSERHETQDGVNYDEAFDVSEWSVKCSGMEQSGSSSGS